MTLREWLVSVGITNPETLLDAEVAREKHAVGQWEVSVSHEASPAPGGTAEIRASVHLGRGRR